MLDQLLPALENELDGEGWDIEWQSARATYRGMECLHLVIRASRVWLRLGAPGRTGFRGHGDFPGKTILEKPEDANADLVANLRRARQVAEEHVDRYLSRRGDPDRLSGT